MNARRCTVLLCLCAGAALPVRAERAWPTLALPADAQVWAVGEQLSANGVPMRVRGFLSPRPPAELARRLREGLGEATVQSRLGDRLILGRAERGFYLTVLLDAVPGGTRALVAVADLQTALRERGRTQSQARRWRERLPAGSQLLSHTQARDGARWSTQIVYRNGVSAERNAQALTAWLLQDGLEPQPTLHDPASGAQVLLFQGRGQEASAVITRGPRGQAQVVLNTVGGGASEGAP
jgi:hypothetical protein